MIEKGRSEAGWWAAGILLGILLGVIEGGPFGIILALAISVPWGLYMADWNRQYRRADCIGAAFVVCCIGLLLLSSVD